jgi:hypothetical protein
MKGKAFGTTTCFVRCQRSQQYSGAWAKSGPARDANQRGTMIPEQPDRFRLISDATANILAAGPSADPRANSDTGFGRSKVVTQMNPRAILFIWMGSLALAWAFGVAAILYPPNGSRQGKCHPKHAGQMGALGNFRPVLDVEGRTAVNRLKLNRRID